MKHWWVGMGLVLAWCSTGAASDEYCHDLKMAGLEGKLVAINAADGGERNVTHGIVVAVLPHALVIELGGTRGYVNCAQIHSVIIEANQELQGADQEQRKTGSGTTTEPQRVR